jgi:catechol 2,3-dioxygenase-like lactoylglutathione lyase family enzyme
MAKLRHIALSVPDPWKAAEFFQRAFGMKKVGETDSVLARGVYLTDGTVNMAILNYKNDEMAGHRGKDFVGIHHLGFWVDDVDQSRENIETSGGKYWMGEVPRTGTDNLFYEVKFHDPNGIVIDISANGWGGATKNVVPAGQVKAIAKKAKAKPKLRAAAHARTQARVSSTKRRSKGKPAKAKRRKAG